MLLELFPFVILSNAMAFVYAYFFSDFLCFDMSLLLLTVTLRGYLISIAYCLFLGPSSMVSGAVARSVACPYHMQAAPRSTLASSTFGFRGDVFPFFAHSSCQSLAKEWTLNACKLTSGDLPMNSVV